MTDQRPPRDNLVRASRPGIELRADAAPVDGSIGTLSGHFSVFNAWYEVNSMWEGHFLERIAPGAFKKTFAENRDGMRVTFNHGQDPQLGDKVLGPIEDLREDGDGAYYEVPLLDTSYNRDLLPGLKAGLYGASFRFRVMKEEFDQKPKESDYNPAGIPERTIKEVQVMEFGPVTFPASPTASAAVRSLTDVYAMRQFVRDPERLAELIDSIRDTALADGADASHSDDASRSDPPDPPPTAAPTVTPDPPKGGSSDSREETPVDSEYITRDDKAARVAELEAAIGRRAVEYPGVFPDDIQAIDEAENAEHDKLQRDIAAWDTRQARLREFSGDPKKVESTHAAPAFIRKAEDIYDLGRIKSEARSLDDVTVKVRENALRSIDGARFAKSANPNALVDIIENQDAGTEGEGEIARRVLLTGSPTYKRAFAKYLRGEKDLWSPEESRAAALAVTGTTTTGGYAVPYVFDPTLLHIGAFTAQNPYRAACRVETITNGNNWRTVTVGAVTTAYAAEAAAATEQGPTFGQPTYTVQRAHAFATVSYETLQDRSDISSELTSVFAESKATYEENQFTLGVGTTVFPQGMFRTTAYTSTTTATNDVTAILDTTLVEAALPLRFRANAAWFMNRSTIRQLQALDTSFRYFSGAGIQYPGNSPISPSPVRTDSGNTGLYLLGYPIWEVPSAVSTLTTDAAIIAVFVDPKSYIIVDRLGMGIEVIPNMLNGATPSFPTGERGIYAFWRNTAKPINADAGRQMTVQ
jgi:HK97 family phage major capsid protein/HK97 family phage prohead protease